MTGRLDAFDLRLLDEFQRDLPLEIQPFAAIGAALGCSEAHVISRIAALQALGMISRVGATIRPNTAGASTLAAMTVPEHRIEEVAALVSAEAGVNHSYLREDEWNLWFVATAPDVRDLQAMLERVTRGTGLRVLDLRLVRPFNIDLGFNLSGERDLRAVRQHVSLRTLTASDRPLLQKLAEGLPLVPRPYASVAAGLGMHEDQVIGRLKALQSAGIISRLGVIVRHRAMGWTANAMVVWDIPDSRIAAAGPALAKQPGVTLCYQRRTVPGVWPYALYNMIHARSRREALEVLDSLKRLPETGDAPHRVLFSTRCFKQTGALVHREEIAA